MFLEFVGSGSALNTALGNNSAFIKKNNTMVLIDCGSTTFSRLQELSLLQGIDQLYVFITHRHPDHISSLGDLVFYSHFILKIKINIMTPDSGNINALLKYMGVEGHLYNIIQLDDKYEIKSKDMEIAFKAMPVTHIEQMACYGYIIEYQNMKIFYSGDSKEIPKDILTLFKQGQIDYIYQDVCSYDYNDSPHLYFRDLCGVIGEEERNRVYCMHFDEGFDQDELIKLGFGLVKNVNK